MVSNSEHIHDDLPWELIALALEGELSPGEDLEFKQWLDQSRDNRDKFANLEVIWRKDIADYQIYSQANEDEGWRALNNKMKPVRRIISMRQWISAAAVLLLIVGCGWWFFSGKSSTYQYATVSGEDKTVTLLDGSTVALEQNTRIELDPGFNKTGRTVKLVKGKAQFEVVHHAEQPFIVEMDAATVKDIGTKFSIEKTSDSLTIVVLEGKVAFSDKETQTTMDLAAGDFLSMTKRAGKWTETGSTHAAVKKSTSLRFVDAPLSQVARALAEKFGKNIHLDENSLGKEKLTVDLDDESFDDALKIICHSLSLETSVNRGEYFLTARHK